MKTARAIWFALAFAAAPAGRAPGFLEGLEFDPSQISQAGQEVIDRLAPDAFKNEYRFATPQEIVAWLAPVQQALAGDSVEALAAIEPQARQALQFLRAYPQTQSYADWLEARMDFLEMAGEVARALPAPSRPAPPKPAPTPAPPAPSKPLPPHPVPPPKPLPPSPIPCAMFYSLVASLSFPGGA